MAGKGLFKVVSFCIISTSLTTQSSADVLPGSAMPEQVSRALKQEEPTAQAPAAGIVQAPKETETPGGEQAKKITFQLNGITLEGNHVYSDEELSKLYKNKLHKTISVAELFGIVQEITNYYRNNGYIISRAILPPQHVKGGVVKIQIIEGFLDQVTIPDQTGSECTKGVPGAKCLVKAYGEKISECRPLQIKRMEKYLLLANEIPATQVRAVLAPSKTTTGAADLNLVTQTKTVGGYLSYDNYGTRYIGPQQITANLNWNSVLTAGDATNFTFTKTPKGGELTYADLNHSLALNAEGARWLLGGTRTQTHPLFVLQPTDIDGLNVNLYTNLIFPWIRTRTDSVTFGINFNYLDSYVTTFDEQLYTDHLRPLGFNVTYNFSDKYYGANMIYADIRQGLPIMGYTSDTNPATAQTSRPGGHAVFTKIDAQYNRLQAIRGPVSLNIVFKGQYAFQPLLASEQFTFGGPILGRGYDVAEMIGDKGLSGSVELRYDVALSKFYLQSLQPYVFYDIGAIWNKNTSPSVITKLSGTSTGLGTRFFFTNFLSGNFMWTQTLTKPVAAEQLIGRGRRSRLWFSVVGSF